MINRILFQLFYQTFRLVSSLFPPTPVDLKGRSFQRILVFSAAGIGDTLTDSVAIRALKESFPKSRLTMLTHRRRAVLAHHNPYADEVLSYHKSLLQFIPWVLRLRKLRPEVIVMLRANDPDIWPMAYLVNRHAVVSCSVMTRFKFLISHPVGIPSWDHTHGVEQTLEIVRSVGAHVKDERLVYQVQEQERQDIRKKLSEHGVEDRPIVVFQVGGGRRSAWRDWPAHSFARLGELLLKTYGVQLILLGGKDLSSKAEVLHELLPKSINLTGKLSLAESAALLSLSKILVSTDTGIMHLGFAVGVDTLALIHCNNPASRVGPHGYGDKHPVAQLEPPPGVKPSKDVRMTLLTVEMVWPKLQALCERHQLAKI